MRLGMRPVLNLLGFGYNAFHTRMDSSLDQINLTLLNDIKEALVHGLEAAFCATH